MISTNQQIIGLEKVILLHMKISDFCIRIWFVVADNLAVNAR